jgi:hypothetical protein
VGSTFWFELPSALGARAASEYAPFAPPRAA